MSSITPEHNPSRPTRSKAETKADITDRTARTIIGAEVERRDVKTARLRQARLERESAGAAAETTAEPRRAKSAAPRQARSST